MSRSIAVPLLALLLTASPAFAAEPEDDEAPRKGDEQPVYFETGLFLGGFFASPSHELFDPVESKFQELSPFGLELGLRAAVLPVPFFGVEAEGGLVPHSADAGGSALLYNFRAHALGQYPGLGIKELTPFAVLGLGRWGVSSDADVLGNDSDGTLHLGLGAKYEFTHQLLARLDYRYTRADAVDVPGEDGASTGHNEVLLGVSWIFGKLAPDEDHDGFRGDTDKCPTVKGISPDGCPDPDPDRDGVLGADDRCPDVPGIPTDGCPDPDPDKDGVKGTDDKCPRVAGIPPDGCPDLDPDKDGVVGEADRCPETPGIPPDGCPDPDPDKDGIPIGPDKCPDQPETKNGFEDEDGCPDELPPEIKKFTGTIEGIKFASDKAQIFKSSYPVLDAAAKVLKEWPDLRMEISGHTDDTGTEARNQELSALRAAAVKDYLINKGGIAPERLESRGAGSSEPVADNKTKDGKAKNRRTEFKPIVK